MRKFAVILCLAVVSVVICWTIVHFSKPSAPVYTAWPFDANEAARRQGETAVKLGISRELTLGMGNNSKGGVVAMKLVLIPAGKFIMGSPEGEKGHYDKEGPQHEVTITKPFYMSIYTITQDQYEQITGTNPSKFNGAQNPVEMVSWDEAVDFCKKLSQKTGKIVRLPTEAEWEYACRAGSNTRFSYGDDNEYTDLDDYAWYKKNSEGKTHTVGQKKPNDWGLYDMHGNVWERCADWFDKYYYAKSENEDPQGPSSGLFRLTRGGSWYTDAQSCRTSYRIISLLGDRLSDVGFRVVVESK